ncbi:MAG: AAA family ATPase [Roseiarcus sp.]
MRLETLTLSPYGRFENKTLAFAAQAPLHVVLGANEAGKTTALAALGDLIYGFPGKTPYGFRHDQRLLRVGGVFRLADGSLLSLRRRKGNVNTLIDADDKPISDAPLLSALGGVDRRTFETEFGLRAEKLREGGAALLEAGGGLAETLAASSANLSALATLQKKLGAEADELFTPRRSAGRRFYVALDAYDAADRRLREATVTPAALEDARTKLLEARARETALKEEHADASRALIKLQRAERTHRKLARLLAIRSELDAFADLGEVDLATFESWRAALAEERALAARLAELAADDAQAAAEIEALSVDEALLVQGPAIDVWREKLGAARKAADDLPRRVEARAQAVATLDEIARRLGLFDHAALVDAEPTDAELARARAAIEARRRAEERLHDALARGQRAFAQRDQLASTAAEPARDPEPFRRRLEPLEQHLADADRLRRERAAIDAEAKALAEAAARLDPPVADIDALARAPVPEAGALARAARREAEISEARRAAEKRLAEARREVEAAEKALSKRRRDAAGQTRADWLAARERRDLALGRLDGALDGEPAPRRGAFDDALALVKAADAIGDAVVADSERAARLEAAAEELAARREALTQAAGEIEQCEAERTAALADAAAAWAPVGVAPRSAEAMARWGERVTELTRRRAELERRRAETQALDEKLASARDAVAAWLEELGRVAPKNFELAFREARAELEAMTKAFAAAREADIQRANVLRTAQESELEIARARAALGEAAAVWPGAMAGLALAATATLEEAEAALEAWRAIAAPKQARAREARSIDGIERDRREFEAAVAAIAREVAPEFAHARAEEALMKLVERLGAARAAGARRAQLLETRAQRAAKQRGEALRREAAGATLAVAADRLGAADTSALALALERLGERRALDEERARMTRDLRETGDGLDEAALTAEQAGLDLALLAGEIELTKRRQAELMAAIPDAARAARDAESEVETLERGRDAAGAARERMEARGELLDIAERWLLRQGAARLAAKAIDRHRAAAQDPLVDRAGKLFRVATAQSFSRLATDYDDADRPTLVAMRADGEKVAIAGLSEGARDQLFLALRLALLERRAGEPLPFIGDDILASFDDARTKLTLALLADFGRARQAILFTHHRHVADLAEGAGADVVEL